MRDVFLAGAIPGAVSGAGLGAAQAYDEAGVRQGLREMFDEYNSSDVAKDAYDAYDREKAASDAKLNKHKQQDTTMSNENQPPNAPSARDIAKHDALGGYMEYMYGGGATPEDVDLRDHEVLSRGAGGFAGGLIGGAATGSVAAGGAALAGLATGMRDPRKLKELAGGAFSLGALPGSIIGVGRGATDSYDEAELRGQMRKDLDAYNAADLEKQAFDAGAAAVLYHAGLLPEQAARPSQVKVAAALRNRR